MTTQREFEKRIWAKLGDHMTATTTDELLGLGEVFDNSSESWSPSDWNRYGNAFERVINQITKHGG